MSSPLADAVLQLSSADVLTRTPAATTIYLQGQSAAMAATSAWWENADLAELLGSRPAVTVGLAVEPPTFENIWRANGRPLLADVPPEQDTREFELHFPDGVALDILTTREMGDQGAIARYLKKFGEGIQQVEFRCADVDRTTRILQAKFALSPVYPEARRGAGGTRINFFLVPSPASGKLLIELYETSPLNRH